MSYKSTSICLLLLALAITPACDTIAKDAAHKDRFVIKRIDSDLARIGMINLKETPTGLYLRGDIRKKNFQRGIIPGHLDIEIIGPDGKSLYKEEIGYMRRNTHSRYSHFATPIDMALVEGSVIQIQHHVTYNIVDHIEH